jgi:FimV-like protein
MPVRILLVLLLVNFSAFALSQSVPTQIRGPKSSDNAFTQQQFGPLTASDTLWRIAEQVKPNNSVTTYQVMYALFLKNPGAFNDANFNHLRPGAILILPDLREIRSVDAEQARRKAELDDQAWAERTRREAEARARAREQAVKPNQVQQQALTELNALKDNYQSSMLLIEGIARENEQLRSSLGRLQQELEGLKAQLAEDSLLQQQLNQLLEQQQAILAEQEARRLAELAAAQAQQQAASSSLLNNPLIWALAASFPAILALIGLLFWFKRRSQKTEEVISAATKEPVAPAGYQSPVPPLDSSQDFDDSLFTLDDSLLDDAFEPAPAAKASTTAAVDDSLTDFSDDILLDDLDVDALSTDALDVPQDDQLDFSLDDVSESDVGAKVDDLNLPESADFNFDANNILSDTDLASLLAAEEEADAEEIIEFAEPEAAAAPELTPSSIADESSQLADQNDIDNLLEEIELDWPLVPDSPASEQAGGANAIQAEEEPETVDQQQIATLLDEQMLATDSIEEIAGAEPRFDSSELEAFAEQLAAEGNQQETSILEELLTEDEERLQTELEDILIQAAEQTTDLDQPLHSAVGSETAEQSEAGLSDEFSSDLTESLAGIGAESDLLSMDLSEEERSATELQLDEALAIDLTEAEDLSVQLPSEAMLAVENPSAVLDTYPELDLSDFDPEDEQQLALLSQQLETLTTDPDADDFEPVVNELTPEELNLTDLEDSQFEQLLDELEQITPRAAELDEPELQSDVTSAEQDKQQEEIESTSDIALADTDFVEIDNLLSALEQPDNDESRFEQLNVDVGLDEFADIIGEHTKMDVDQEDNGFAAKLDLVRAYIEMDEPESATLLIDEILTSAAPEHVKDEARQLRPE